MKSRQRSPKTTDAAYTLILLPHSPPQEPGLLLPAIVRINPLVLLAALPSI